MHYYFAVWSLVLGLVIGSFLNVVIWRMPRRESLVRPGSHCPACGAGIGWYDNLPVLSWLLLHGRCRSCRSRIAARYPLVESLTGVAFLGAFLFVGPVPAVLLAWALTAVVVALAFIHHDHAVVPRVLLFPATLCALVASIALDPDHWWYYPVAAAGAGLLALGLSSLTPGRTHLSEAKIALLLGAVFGPCALFGVPIAFLLLTIARISLVFCQKGRLRARTVFTRV